MNNLRISTIHSQQITITVNGEKMPAYEGESLHAALLAAGKRPLRKPLKSEQHRGIFCGMGVCYECLVTVNGVPNIRSCMTEVVADMDIEIDEN